MEGVARFDARLRMNHASREDVRFRLGTEATLDDARTCSGRRSPVDGSMEISALHRPGHRADGCQVKRCEKKFNRRCHIEL